MPIKRLRDRVIIDHALIGRRRAPLKPHLRLRFMGQKGKVIRGDKTVDFDLSLPVEIHPEMTFKKFVESNWWPYTVTAVELYDDIKRRPVEPRSANRMKLKTICQF